MDGSYMADSRPRIVHRELAIDPRDVAVVSTDGNGYHVLLRNGHTLTILGDAAMPLIATLDALSRDES